MKFFVRIGETCIGVKIDRSGIEIKDLSEIKAQIDADVAAKGAIVTALETNAETLKKEIKIFHEIIDTISGAEKSSAGKFARNIARAYMNKAAREGRTEDDGFEDYLETLGIVRSEKADTLLSKIRERDRELDKRLKRNLDEFQMT